MFDPIKIREDFPILKRLIKNNPLVYLDSAATTQKPLHVIEAIEKYYRNNNANVHRGAYTLSEEATSLYEEARLKTAGFINSEMTESIIFTRNATEGINLVANSWGRANLKEGDEVLLTQMEHHSNLIPWQLITKEKGAKLKFIPLTPDGKLDLTNIHKLLNEKTKFVSVVHISNSLGTINPVEEIITLAHRLNIPVLLDASQSVPHRPVDVQSLDCDFLVFSGHKMLGPTGIGVLYGKYNLLDNMPPFMGGGEMINEVQLEWSDFRNLPWKYEAGTPHIAGAIGLGVAIDYLKNIGFENIQQHDKELVSYAMEVLTNLDGIEIYGPKDTRGSLVAFNLKGVHPHDVSTILDEDGIAIRAGHHCTQPIMRWLDVAATVRASFYLYNTKSDIDKLATGLKKVKEIFKRGS
ncbi:MAG: cysteine desulfurase [Bacteroidota bacterium]|nr:cysteine desulfurase [Bacteroidota bacterium]